MLFNKLRLSGFKSFVDPVELPIQQGLTGVVGPNGCGKSNLVEALRWAMGETSAKRMRGGEMDDVIFGGTATRPSRNVAEVVIGVDNADKQAPAAFNDADELEINRRIERGRGSGYRINGREVRARDVQLLFADAATGARANGLVSQGRIGALINAKPVERRGLLEEAANIRGLHTRRHEAELRLRAAEANLERLEDVLLALDGQMQGLRKQARQATRYRNVAEQIRQAESVLYHMRWQSALAAREDAAGKLREAETVAGRLAESAANAAKEQADASAGLPELRKTEAEAAAEYQRLTAARAELEAEDRRVATAKSEAETRLRQIADDIEREGTLAEDAKAAMTRLTDERQAIATAAEGESEALARATQILAEANRAAEQIEDKLTDLTEKIATTEARRGALDRQVRQMTDRLEKLDLEERQIAEQKVKLQAEAVGEGEVDAANAELEAAEQALDAAREKAENIDETRSSAEQAERDAREVLNQVNAAMAKLSAEADALEAMLSDGDDDSGAPILDKVAAEPGYEAALGVALGDDLAAPVAESEASSLRHWRTLPPLSASSGPKGSVEILADRVQAPGILARRLSQIGVVDTLETAFALQGDLGPGQRLVTKDGDLVRWDGFVVRSGAASSAAVRLKQRNRLAELHEEIRSSEKSQAGAADQLAECEEKMALVVEDERATRDAVNQAFSAVDSARAKHSELQARLTTVDAKLSSLDDAAARIVGEKQDATEQKTTAEAGLQELDDVETMRRDSADLRADLADRRAGLIDARGEHDRINREAEVRRTRISAIDGEAQTWVDRSERADSRLSELRARHAAETAEIARLAARPSEIADQMGKLGNAIEEAEAKRRAAADKLVRAESHLSEYDKRLKEVERALGEARENMVRAEGGVEQTNQALFTLKERIAERLECAPSEILEKAGIDPEASQPDEVALSARLERLTRERDNIGPVNLRAEQEVEELKEQISGMENERDDLVAAIARLRSAISSLNKEGRERLLASFKKVDSHFRELFVKLFGGGQAHLALTETEDPLEAGLEIMASPPGKKLQVMSLLSGGEQALTALALVFAAFLVNPAPICVLDEVDAPLDDSNVDRFCTLLDHIAETTGTRFLVITHHRMTMARMHRLFGVTMAERGVSQLVSVDLDGAEELRESA